MGKRGNGEERDLGRVTGSGQEDQPLQSDSDDRRWTEAPRCRSKVTRHAHPIRVARRRDEDHTSAHESSHMAERRGHRWRLLEECPRSTVVLLPSSPS